MSLHRLLQILEQILMLYKLAMVLTQSLAQQTKQMSQRVKSRHKWFKNRKSRNKKLNLNQRYGMILTRCKIYSKLELQTKKRMNFGSFDSASNLINYNTFEHNFKVC